MEAKLTKHTLINGLRDVSNLAELARKLGVNRTTVYRAAKRFGVELICGRQDKQHFVIADDKAVAIESKSLPARELRRDSVYSSRELGDVGPRR